MSGSSSTVEAKLGTADERDPEPGDDHQDRVGDPDFLRDQRDGRDDRQEQQDELESFHRRQA